MIRYQFILRLGRDQLGQLEALYKRAGWWGKNDSLRMLKKLVAGSHCFLVALEGGRLVGMGRAVSDRVSDAYIQDIFVLKSHRRYRIGSSIVRRLVRRLKADRMRWIGLIAADGSHPFYRKLGFARIPKSDPMLLQR